MNNRKKNPIQILKDKLRPAIKKNALLLLFWNELLRARGKRELKKYSDLQAVNMLYYFWSKRYPDLTNPTLFSEKMQWLKLFYHDPLMAQCSDKYEVRGYIEEKGYADILNKLFGVYEKTEDIDFDKLPDKFVIKATQGSGWNIICKNKNKMNWTLWRLIMKSWLKHNIFWNGREWVYKNLKPRLVCEKYLENIGGNLIDYKLYCFNGVPKFVQANMGRGTKHHAQNFYDLNWSLLPFGKDLAPLPDLKIPQPENIERMIAIAKDLSSPFPYVRADFYDVFGKIIFGELTFFPISGMPDFIPPEYDFIIGNQLILPKILT